MPLSKTGAELLFEMISQRYERGATLITSNLPFVMSKTCILHDEWTETFGTERLTGALLDRLTHHVVRRAGRPLDAPIIRLTLRDERRELSSGAKPHPKIHRTRLIQPALSWPQRAKAASQPPAIRGARLTGRRLVARVMPKPKVAWFCAALWPGFTPPLTSQIEFFWLSTKVGGGSGRMWRRFGSSMRAFKVSCNALRRHGASKFRGRCGRDGAGISGWGGAFALGKLTRVLVEIRFKPAIT